MSEGKSVLQIMQDALYVYKTIFPFTQAHGMSGYKERDTQIMREGKLRDCPHR